MKRIRLLVPLALTVLLTACGGNGPPPTPPTTPVDPPTGQPANPGENVAYYGEWGWNFEGKESYQTREGRFSVLESDTEVENQSIGLFQFCYSACYDSPEGYVRIGLDDEGKLALSLFRLSSTNDLVRIYRAVDTDGELTKDEQGRKVFEGRGTAYEEFVDAVNGTFSAVLIADEPALAFAP